MKGDSVARASSCPCGDWRGSATFEKVVEVVSLEVFPGWDEPVNRLIAQGWEILTVAAVSDITRGGIARTKVVYVLCQRADPELPPSGGQDQD